MNHPQFTCKHLNQKQLADYWGVSQRTLERWRAIGWGPLFLKIAAVWSTGQKISLPTRSSTSPNLPNRGPATD